MIATTDDRTIPCSWMLPNLIESPDKPAIKTTDVKIKLSDFE